MVAHHSRTLASKADRLRLAAPALLAAITLATGAAQAAGTLTFCLGAAPEGFDIAQYTTGVTYNAAGVTLYDTLTRNLPGKAGVQPGLAESWQASADGLSVTMKLRAGVRFHSTPWFKPTREFNADDVLFSFNRMNDKKHPAHAAARNGFVYWTGLEMHKLVARVEKLDPATVRFTLTRPDSTFLASLGVATVGPIVSAEYGEQLIKAGKLDRLNSQPVGTGPFVFRSYQKDAVVRYAPHAEYWGGAPKLDQLVFAVTRDADVALQRVKAGECLVAEVRAERASQLAGHAGITTHRQTGLTTVFVAPNNERPFLKDQRLREALWLAIDKNNINRIAFGGTAVPAANFLPPDLWSYDKSLAERSGVDKARELVKASGYDGRELKLFVSGDTRPRRVAEMLQADWARIGVKVRVMTMDLGTLFKRTEAGEHDLTYQSWQSDNGDPDNFLAPNLSCAAVAGGGNKARWCNAEFDKLLEAGRRSTDPAERTRIYQRAQKLLYDDAALIPVVYMTVTTAVHNKVRGYQPNAFGIHDFRGATVGAE